MKNILETSSAIIKNAIGVLAILVPIVIVAWFFNTMFDYFTKYPANGVTINDVSDYFGSVMLAAWANVARVMYFQFEKHENGGWKRLATAPVVGGAFGLAMAMFAAFAFKSDEVTWLFAMVAGLLGPSWVLDKLKAWSDEALKKAGDNANKNIDQDIDRRREKEYITEDVEFKQAKEIDELKHKQEMKELEAVLNENI